MLITYYVIGAILGYTAGTARGNAGSSSVCRMGGCSSAAVRARCWDQLAVRDQLAVTGPMPCSTTADHHHPSARYAAADASSRTFALTVAAEERRASGATSVITFSGELLWAVVASNRTSGDVGNGG